MAHNRVYVKMPWQKRLFDFIIAILFFLILLPLVLLIVLSLIIEQFFCPEARGPVLYSEKRISGGRTFLLHKIRTCKKKAYERELREKGFIHTARVESNPQNFLKVGWLAKKIYMDEFPQLWNVVRGQISLVGPRPANLKNYDNLIRQGIFTKTDIVCGLTGLFQSFKGHHTKNDVSMDTEYMEFCKNNSPAKIVWNDIKIIWRTIGIVLEHKGK